MSSNKSNTIKNSKSIDSIKESFNPPKQKVKSGVTSTMNGLKKTPKIAIMIVAKNMKKKK